MAKSKLKTVKTTNKEKISINGKLISVAGQQGINKIVSAQSGNPYIRDEWNEGNWTFDRPNESVPWSDPLKIIEMCFNTYFSVGIIGNIIDLMVDFSVEGLKIQHPNRSVQNFLNGWWVSIKGNKILHDIFLDLFRAGNSIVRQRTTTIDKATQLQLSKIGASVDAKEFPTNETALEPREIPYQYITYNPTSLRVYGDETVGSIEYYIVLDKNSIDAIYGVDRMKLRKAITNKDIKQKGLNYEYRLPKDKTTHLSWRKPSYMKYGYPFTARILDEILTRHKLFVCLRAAADGWMSAIRIWKLGQQKGGPETLIYPNEAQFAKLAKVLKSQQPGAALDILWNFAIEVEEHYPPAKEIFSSVPLETIRKEIKDGLGIPDVLIDGGGGNFANAFLAIKTLVERLDYARELVMNDWLMPQLNAISESLAFRVSPTVKWGYMNLRDETTMLKLITALRDRKLISKESVLEEFGMTKTIEDARLEEETAQSKSNKDAFKDFGPFFIDPTQAKNLAGGGRVGKEPSARGKPPGKNAPIGKKRDTSPKGLKVKSTKDDHDHLDAPAVLESCVSDVHKKLLKEHHSKNGKHASSKKSKELLSNAWAICRSKLKMSDETIEDSCSDNNLSESV